MNDREAPPPDSPSAPETYMPRLQLAIRVSMGALSALYFNLAPVPTLLLTPDRINAVIAGYLAFHLLGWLYFRRRGATSLWIRLGAWVDLAGAFAAILFDPFDIPPMLLLLAICVLGNGIQHGLSVYVESMIGALLLGCAGLAVHYLQLDRRPPYNLYFYVTLLVFATYYSYLLVGRIEFMKKEAIRMSERDPLTGILNRRAFIKAADDLLRLHERGPLPLVFIIADLDRFKAVNDTYGHQTGDGVLRCFADRVRSRLRRSDVFARYGGDEFVIILTHAAAEDAKTLLRQFQNDFRDCGQSLGLGVSVSFGMGVVPEGKNDLDDILRQVDTALYEAKLREGQDRIVVAPLGRNIYVENRP